VLARYRRKALPAASVTADHACRGVLPRRHDHRHHARPTAMPAISTHDGMKSIDHQRVATRFMGLSR